MSEGAYKKYSITRIVLVTAIVCGAAFIGFKADLLEMIHQHRDSTNARGLSKSSSMDPDDSSIQARPVTFDCTQKSHTYLAEKPSHYAHEKMRLTLKFYPATQTLTLGSLTGLQYRKEKNLIYFTNRSGYLDQHQFTDAYTFQASIGQLKQEVLMSLNGATVSVSEDTHTQWVYRSRYSCIKTSLRQSAENSY